MLDSDPGPDSPLLVERIDGPDVDTRRLDRLHNEVFTGHMAGPAFESEWERQGGRVVIARRSHHWLAYALAAAAPWDDAEGEWFLQLIGVRPEAQRKGHGLRVTTELVAWLTEDGATLVHALPKSDGGHRVLERLGFARDPEWGSSMNLRIEQS